MPERHPQKRSRGTWKPGQPGNPTGKNKSDPPKPKIQVFKDGNLVPKKDYNLEFYDAYLYRAQGIALVALDRLQDIILNSTNTPSVVMAIKEVNNRALGQAYQEVSINANVNHTVTYADKLKELAQVIELEAGTVTIEQIPLEVLPPKRGPGRPKKLVNIQAELNDEAGD